MQKMKCHPGGDWHPEWGVRSKLYLLILSYLYNCIQPWLTGATVTKSTKMHCGYVISISLTTEGLKTVAVGAESSPGIQFVTFLLIR